MKESKKITFLIEEQQDAIISIIDELIALKKEIREKKDGGSNSLNKLDEIQEKVKTKFIYKQEGECFHSCQKPAVASKINTCSKKCVHLFSIRILCCLEDRLKARAEKENISKCELIEKIVMQNYVEKDYYFFNPKELKKYENITNPTQIAIDIESWKKIKAYQKKYKFQYLSRFFNYAIHKQI